MTYYSSKFMTPNFELPYEFCESVNLMIGENVIYAYSIIKTMSTNIITSIVLKFYNFELSRAFMNVLV
jgi:hypothetical protein